MANFHDIVIIKYIGSINNITNTCGLALEKIYKHENNIFSNINDGIIKISAKAGLGLD